MPSRLSPFRIALLYAGFAALWIFISDTLLVFNVKDPQLEGYIGMAKGLAFVAITSTLLYLLLARWHKVLNTSLIQSLRAVDVLKLQGLELTRSQKLIQDVVDNSTALIYMFDTEGQCILANKKFLNLFNIEHEQLIGHDRTVILPKEIADQHRKNDLELLSTLNPTTFEEISIAEDGLHYYMSHKFPLFNEEGKVFGVCGISTDTTEHKAAKAKIQRLSQLYITLSQCNQAIVRCTSENDLFTQICHAAVHYGGMKMVWIGFVDPDTKMVQPVASYGEGSEYLQDVKISVDVDSPFGNGPTGRAIRENQTYWCQDYMNDSLTLPWRERVAKFGLPGLGLCCRYTEKGKRIGAISLYSGEINAFDTAAQNLLVEMSEDISYALNNFDLDIERSLAEKALFESEQHLRTLIETEPECVKVVSRSGELLEMNSAGLAMLEADSLDAAQQRPLIDFILPEYRTYFDDLHKGVMNGDSGSLEFEITGLKGKRRWLETHAAPMRDGNGEVVSLLGITRDITERKLAEKILRESEEKFHLLFDRSMDGILILENNQFIEFNPAVLNMMGGNAEQMKNTLPWKLSPLVQPDGRLSEEKAHEMIRIAKTQGRHRFEWVHCRMNGEEFPVEVTLIPITLEGREVLYTTWRDIANQKLAEKRIMQLANFDALTGLPNRSMLTDRASHAISMAQRSEVPLTLMFLDLDHFKNVNDSLGHGIGDKLLISLAERLKNSLREEDTISRLGGDEFIMVLPGTDADGATHVAEKLLTTVAEPYHIDQFELIITPSIGIAMYPIDGTDFDALSKCADIAMYRAKQSGRNTYRFYTPEMQERSVRTLQLENALRHAIEYNQLLLHYQPQISMESGRMIGAEALIRWQHPEFGLVSPADFIPIAEDTGQILQIGEWVLRTAVNQLKAWIDNGLEPITIAVNLSAVQFRHLHLPELITQILEEAKLPPQYLELELTEGVAMDNPIAAIGVMDDLHARGIRMSIDDFGTGYSSLSYLKRFQVYKLKIDQSFVRDICKDSEDEAIVEAIISLAKSLSLETIAEGVETLEQLEFLRSKGCNEAQGYYLSKPLSAEKFEAYFKVVSNPISTT